MAGIEADLMKLCIHYCAVVSENDIQSCYKPVDEELLVAFVFEDQPCFVALLDGVAVGHCVAYYTKRRGALCINLMSIVVREDCRRNLIGTSLLDELKKYLDVDRSKIYTIVPEECTEAHCFLRENDFRCNEIKKLKSGRVVYVFEFFYCG